jgi:arginyl-tRNA synthetase
VTSAALAELVRDAALQVLSTRDLDVSVLPSAVTVERPRNPRHGHYATNVAMTIAKQIGVPPRELATWLSEALTAEDTIQAADVAGPGFVNLTLASSAYRLIVREASRRTGCFDCGELYRGVRVRLDFPAGPRTLTDARQRVVGAALGRIFAAFGAEGVDGTTGRTDEHGSRVDVRVRLVGPGETGHAAPAEEVLVGQPVSAGSATVDDLVAAAGEDAVCYSLVRSDMDFPLEIDADLIGKHTNDNPLFAVQYAHARLCSVQRRAAGLGIDPGPVDDADFSSLTGDAERELIRTLGEYPSVVRSAALHRQPRRVARYLEELAGAYDRFDAVVRLLGPGDDQAGSLTCARIHVCAATRGVLANALGLLGAGAPERL